MAADIIILINLFKNTLLKLNKLSFFKKKNNTIQLNQDDIVVAIGIIIKPIWLKNVILIKIFNKPKPKKFGMAF